MRRNVTFRSTVPVDLDQHPPGEELAEYIAEKMTATGLKARIVDVYANSAWWIKLEAEQRMPWALLGYINDGPAEWLLQIYSSVGWFGWLLGRSDESERRLFTGRLQALLVGDPHFRDVRWHSGVWSDSGWSSNPAEQDGV
ncbi:MAG: hypothetical protein LC104_18445 [Bacteroidales bacterium]|nr:hypothetical protein [Bacteroidales bacterium]